MDLSRERYAQLYGPTTGDRIRLADTDLLIEVTEDRCGGPGRAGDEAVFGGGKVLRESMGQGRATRAEGAPDLVITGAVVLDHWGVIKADVGDPGRPDRRARQGRQPRHDGRRPSRPGDGPGDRGAGRQRADPHRRRRRLPRALHLPADRAGGARVRGDHADRRRHRPGRGHQGDDRDPGRLVPGPDARGDGPVAGQRRPAGQGEHGLRTRRWRSSCGRARPG